MRRGLVDFLREFWSQLYDDCYENYKGLTKNPKWLLMRKIGRFKIGRYWMSGFSKSSYKFVILDKESQSVFKDIKVESVVNSLRKEGCHLKINLPQEIVRELLDFAKSTSCYGNRKPNLGFYYNKKEQAQLRCGKSFITGCYFNTALLCPAIKRLQSDPVLLAIAAQYLESEPVHQGTQLWWSFPGKPTVREQCQAAQMFHYDLDDYRFIKFFFYLTDVDLSGGYHVCIRGSHKKKKLSHLFIHKRYKDRDIIDYYGADNIVNVCGEAGFGFAEDTFGFHKGTTPIQRDRLLLQIEFGRTDYGMQHDLIDTTLLKCIS